LFLLLFVTYDLLLCFLLSLVALECIALHHLPLSFAFYAPRFLILIISYDFVVCNVVVLYFIYVVNYLFKYVVCFSYSVS